MVVLITLDSSKKWSLFAGYLDIAYRYSFCRSGTPRFSASSGDTVIFFLLNKRPYLSRRLICDVPGKLLRCTTPSNSSLCCISDTYVLGVMCFCTSMYSRTFVSLFRLGEISAWYSNRRNCYIVTTNNVSYECTSPTFLAIARWPKPWWLKSSIRPQTREGSVLPLSYKPPFAFTPNSLFASDRKKYICYFKLNYLSCKGCRRTSLFFYFYFRIS